MPPTHRCPGLTVLTPVLIIGQVVQYKQQSRLEEKRKKALDLQLDFIVGQTERYSDLLSQSLAAATPAGNNETPSSPAKPSTKQVGDEDGGCHVLLMSLKGTLRHVVNWCSKFGCVLKKSDDQDMMLNIWWALISPNSIFLKTLFDEREEFVYDSVPKVQEFRHGHGCSKLKTNS